LTIPAVLNLRRPLLEYLAHDENYHSLYDCVNYLANKFQITDEEREQKFGGKVPRKIFHKRVIDVVSQFRIAELIEDETKPGDASFRINKIGLALLDKNKDEITNKTLKQFGEYSSLEKNDDINKNKNDEEKSEEETLQDIVKQYENRVQLELLKQIKSRCTPEGFEKLCLGLFEKMGYGEAKHTGKAGDRGIDGIISEDKLGLRQIYVQTKRHEQSITYDDVDKFYGKCVRDKVSGIFVTTSDFSKNTIDEMEREHLIKLINGKDLAKYLYQYNVGIETYDKIELKQINLDELDSFN
jgi:restriction system protein